MSHFIYKGNLLGNTIHRKKSISFDEDKSTLTVGDLKSTTNFGNAVKVSVRAATTSPLSSLPNISSVTFTSATPLLLFDGKATDHPDTFILQFAFTVSTVNIDGQNCAVKDRIIVKNETDLTRNGIYTVTSISGNTVIITRSYDMRISPLVTTDVELPGITRSGTLVTCDRGIVNSNTVYFIKNVSSSSVIQFGISQIIFAAFSSSPPLGGGSDPNGAITKFDTQTLSIGLQNIDVDNIVIQAFRFETGDTTATLNTTSSTQDGRFFIFYMKGTSGTATLDFGTTYMFSDSNNDDFQTIDLIPGSSVTIIFDKESSRWRSINSGFL